MSSDVLVVDSNSFPPIVDAPKVLKRKSKSPIVVAQESEIERWVDDDAAQQCDPGAGFEPLAQDACGAPDSASKAN